MEWNIFRLLLFKKRFESLTIKKNSNYAYVITSTNQAHVVFNNHFFNVIYNYVAGSVNIFIKEFSTHSIFRLISLHCKYITIIPHMATHKILSTFNKCICVCKRFKENMIHMRCICNALISFVIFFNIIIFAQKSWLWAEKFCTVIFIYVSKRIL